MYCIYIVYIYLLFTLKEKNIFNKKKTQNSKKKIKTPATIFLFCVPWEESDNLMNTGVVRVNFNSD